MHLILNLWSAKDLTLLGKITVLKTQVISKIFQNGSYLLVHLPKSFINQLNKAMFKFIWSSRWEKISRSKLCGNIKDRGVKMFNVKQCLLALQCKWMLNFLTKIFNTFESYSKHMSFEQFAFLCFMLKLQTKWMIVNSLVLLRFSKYETKIFLTYFRRLKWNRYSNPVFMVEQKLQYRDKSIFNDECLRFSSAD